MKTIQRTEQIEVTDKLFDDFFTEHTLFFDIETTGFSPKSTMTYLIGAACRKGNKIKICQFFAEQKDDESEMISAFLKLMEGFDTLITFNGSGFDIPYLKNRCSLLHLKECFDTYEHLDLYKRVAKISHFLHLPDKKQKSIENFLGIGRDDLFGGGELIEVYYDYVRTRNKELEAFLLLHNFEDVLGMTKLLPILSYSELFCHPPQVDSIEKSDNQEMILTLKSPYYFPKQVSCRGTECYLTVYKNMVKIMVKIYQGELYFFYPDYKNYYYLPLEDIAVHKSIAEFVDKSNRQKAKAANCYAKRQGDFLPQFSARFTPCFYPQYKSKKSYLELTDIFLADSTLQMDYARYLLQAFYDKTAL